MKSPISDTLEIERLFHTYGACASAVQALRVIEETSAIRQMMVSIEREEALMRFAGVNLAVQKAMESVEREKALARSFLGPLGDQLRTLPHSAASWHREMERTRPVMQDFESRFRLPELADTARLIAELRVSTLAESLTRYSVHTSAMQRAIESMRSPWLDVHDQLRSLASFAELQGIGQMVQSMAPFGEHLSDTLRLELGDWRDPITWRPEVLADLEARSSFYAGLGFDRALTAFPAPAFAESLDISGLRREPPSLVDGYGHPVPHSGDEEQEEGFERTNTAYDWITRFETQVRAFIDGEMTRVYGANWPKHRLPNGLYDAWKEKKQKAQESGAADWPLIAYADFTDYERVICRADNWQEVFAAYFGRPERVRESLQRLYPIRLETMHARLITQDDELLLYVEVRRLTKLIVRK